jgi:hypothetical protein
MPSAVGLAPTLLPLPAEILAATTVAEAAFDRQHYDELWCCWHALQEEQP